jgi:hypothetical protein
MISDSKTQIHIDLFLTSSICHRIRTPMMQSDYPCLLMPSMLGELQASLLTAGQREVLDNLVAAFPGY